MSQEWPLRMIQAEIASGKATRRSLGVLYMVAMASNRELATGGFGDFRAINEAIGNHLGGATSLERMRKLDGVKQIGWQLFEAVAAQGTEARRAETGTGSVHDGPVAEGDASNSHRGNHP